MNFKTLNKTVEDEVARQNEGLVMIPSENRPSKKVLELLASPLNNKYSEGYPGKRYYTGNKFIDIIEEETRQKAAELFGAEHANVQPHSGSNANFAAFIALLNPGDKVLSMNLQHGGHLTHGAKLNFSGQLYSFIHYGVNKKTGVLDYDNIEYLVKKEKPKLVISGASSYTRIIDFKKITDIAHKYNAFHLADISHIAGLVLAKLHPTASSADIITFTTHKTLKGPRGAVILCKTNLAKKIDSAVFPGFQGGPMEHVIAAKMACFIEAETKEFISYQKQILVNAKVLEKVFKAQGLELVFGGTDNHMILIDVSKLGYNGHEIAVALEKANIFVNKNVIPFDTAPPYYPSGIRLGTPYLTARGMKDSEMEVIGEWIGKILVDPKNESLIKEVHQNVSGLTRKF
jgi:glycine hydroxymethyltransferase